MPPQQDKRLRAIVRHISDAVQPTKIILFGSRAKGEARPGSDYDLTIVYDGDLSKREVKLAARKQPWEVDASVDLFVLTSQELERFKGIANSLAREVTERGVIVRGEG